MYVEQIHRKILRIANVMSINSLSKKSTHIREKVKSTLWKIYFQSVYVLQETIHQISALMEAFNH
jgi:adenylosuccinate synthase